MVVAMEMLEEGFREIVVAAIARADSSGQDVAEYLNRYGLLATPQWKNAVRAEMVQFVADAIEVAHRAAPRAPDVLVITVRQLRLLAETILKGEWKK
jgi:hypothetical protein